jgi:hypothetical protein
MIAVDEIEWSDSYVKGFCLDFACVLLRWCVFLVYIKFETWWYNLWNDKNPELLSMIRYSEWYQREKGLSKLFRFCFFHVSLLCSFSSFCQSCLDFVSFVLLCCVLFLGFDKNPIFSLIRSGLCEGRPTGIGFLFSCFRSFLFSSVFCTAGFFSGKYLLKKIYFEILRIDNSIESPWMELCQRKYMFA